MKILSSMNCANMLTKNTAFCTTCCLISWFMHHQFSNFVPTGVFVFRQSISRERFGPGTGAIVFGYMRCGGSETSLQSCSTSSSSRYCSHDSDVGVTALMIQVRT